MRTTLIIPDSVYERVKESARGRQATISEFVTEALEAKLLRDESVTSENRVPYRVPSVSMGPAMADIDNREELYRTMEE